MNRRITGVVAAAALAAGLAGGIGACGGGGSPPDATTILQNNGYTPVSLSSLGSSADALTNALPAGDVSSSAVGDKGSEYQFVIVTTSQGDSDVNKSGQLSSEESQAASVGVTLTYSNNVLTLTGTPAQLSNLPNNGG